jgi:hypothetical protein
MTYLSCRLVVVKAVMAFLDCRSLRLAGHVLLNTDDLPFLGLVRERIGLGELPLGLYISSDHT